VTPVNVGLPQDRYLHDDTDALSFLWQLARGIDDQIGSPGTTTITLQRNRRIRIDVPSSVGLFTITWGANTDVRDALGFTGNLSGDRTYTATGISNRLWCPGLTEISDARLGRQGTPHYDTQVGGGGSFVKPVMTTHNYRIKNSLEWRNVINTAAASRVWSTEIGGEYYAFWRDVMVTGGQWTHYRATDNDESSIVNVGLSSANRRGPYVWIPRSGAVQFDYNRSISNVEARSDVKITCMQVAELS